MPQQKDKPRTLVPLFGGEFLINKYSPGKPGDMRVPSEFAVPGPVHGLQSPESESEVKLQDTVQFSLPVESPGTPSRDEALERPIDLALRRSFESERY